MKIFFSILLLLMTAPAMAGGPWMIDTVERSGVPARWSFDNNLKKYVLHWKVDPGPLTDGGSNGRFIGSEEAVTDWIKPLLDDWENVTIPAKAGEPPVKTANIKMMFEGELSLKEGDITVANYKQFLQAGKIVIPDVAVMIFDADGSIIKDQCLKSGGSEADCACASGSARTMEKNGVKEACGQMVGQGMPTPDSTSKLLRYGYIILNGRLINGLDTENDVEMDPEGFKSVIKHEFGHLLNLDHAQVNVQSAESCTEKNCEGGQGIATMYPAWLTLEQNSLHRDDRVAISWLYPSDDFKAKFCLIVGEVKDVAGKGMQGVNVVAQNVSDPIVDVRAFVSGVLYPPHTPNGSYVLAGIVPGQSYQVSYEELLAKYNQNDASGFGPLLGDSPTGFGSGMITNKAGATSVSCQKGGEVIEMETVQVGKAAATATAEPENTNASAAPEETGSGGCQLILP